MRDTHHINFMKGFAMAIPYTYLNARETLALSERFLPRTTSFDPTNIYINDLSHFISREQSDLKNTLGITAGSSFTEEINSEDFVFGEATKDFRDLIMIKKDLTMLADESAASGEVATVFDEFGTHVYDLPREQQVVQADAMLVVFETPEKQDSILRSGSLPLYELFKGSHIKLKGLIRDRVAENESEIGESASKLGRALGRSLNDLYQHVDKYTRIGNSSYEDLLDQLNVELNEVLPQARARRTRNS
jgi:hypothetical protein